MDDICNSLNNSFPKKDDEIIGNNISNIAISDKRESRYERAYSIYLSLANFLEMIQDKHSFESLSLVQRLSGVFYNYHKELFPENWREMYDENCPNLDKYESIKEDLEIIFNTQHTPQNLVPKLELSQEIYIQLFKFSGVFPEFYT